MLFPLVMKFPEVQKLLASEDQEGMMNAIGDLENKCSSMQDQAYNINESWYRRHRAVTSQSARESAIRPPKVGTDVLWIPEYAMSVGYLTLQCSGP